MANESDAPQSGDHAVVVGGSIAGLLAARVLSNSFEQVTVFDRDSFPAESVGRKGVPQSRQAHALLARGANGLEKLFPGFCDDMVAAGVPSGDGQAEIIWYLDGHRMAAGDAGLRGYATTRPFIEAMIRDRVKRLPNVTVIEQAEATALLVDDGQVRGVRVRRDGESVDELVPAGLVVDAAGRGSRALVWLKELGYPLPEQSVVRADVTYVTGLFKQTPGVLDGYVGVSVGPFPGHPRGGAVLRQEADRFVVLLAGMLGEVPPTDHAAMVEFASTLAGPEVADVLRSAEPVGDPVKMRSPGSFLNHFGRLDRHPEGYLVVGDALCTFNPLYGQGMTVAVMEAELISSLLADGVSGLPDRFYAQVAVLLAEPWALAVGGDLRFPEVEGERSPQSEQAGKYLDQYRASAAIDPVLGKAFIHVMNLVAPLTSLFSPELMERVQNPIPERSAAPAAAVSASTEE